MVHQQFSPDYPEYYPWEMLEHEGREIKNAIEQEWLQLLNKEHNEKSVYLDFLAKHATLFFNNLAQWEGPVVISKLKLDDEFTVDFVLPQDEFTVGIGYHLIKIVSPHQTAYSLGYTLSQALSQAIHEVEEWAKWIKNNPIPAKRLFPSGGRLREMLHFWIFIGRSNSPDDYRPYKVKDVSIEVKAFDYLTENLQERNFENIMHVPASEWSYLPLIVRNKITNPFFKALSLMKTG
jgi:hypothetical protein